MNIIASRKNALSEEQIKSFWEKNFDAKFEFRYLKDIVDKPNDLPAICLIHTGLEKNNINNGYNDHWLLITYDKLFDSYSYHKHYNLKNLPKIVSFVDLHPARIQSFGSTVCGEYCLQFLDYFLKNQHKETNLGLDFCKEYGYSTNTVANDEKVLQWYDQKK